MTQDVESQVIINENDSTVNIDDSPIDVTVSEESVSVISVSTQGPQGSQGLQGIQGDKGDKGDPGDTGSQGVAGGSYEFDQLIASNIWVVVHNLNGHPAVSVVDSADSEIIGDVSYDSANQLTVIFTYPFAGKAYLII